MTVRDYQLMSQLTAVREKVFLFVHRQA